MADPAGIRRPLASLRRRRFVAAIAGGLLAAPLAAESQQPRRVYRIALLYVLLPSIGGQGPFEDRMREFGWVKGRDFVTERRSFEGQYEREGNLATELLRAGVDIFEGGYDAALVQKVTRTIPIVVTMGGDLVLSGVAANLTRPGGNVTGIQTLQPQLVGKQVSLLKDANLRLSRSSVLVHVSDRSKPSPFNESIAHESEATAKVLGISLQIVSVSDADELVKAFSTFLAQRIQGVAIVRDAFMGAHLEMMINLALKFRLPTISEMGSLAARGGLMSYGYNFDDAVRKADDIVDKILRGADVSEIPIQQTTTFRFVINLKTAKALGLTIPPSLVARADQVIE